MRPRAADTVGTPVLAPDPPTPVNRTLSILLSALALASCATLPADTPDPPEGPPQRETVYALTDTHELLRFNAGQPRRILERKPLRGLPAGDAVVGIDYRVARGVLYALTRSGALYTVDTATGGLTRVGSAPLGLSLPDGAYGVDFNPVADRLRVVSGRFNLRVHPDTGTAVDFDPATPGLQPDPELHYAAGDAAAGRTPDVVGAAYTYNKTDDKLTTNYALDRATGTLVMQGSREGVQPVVSPNTGRLSTVGPLGLGPLADASFDIADVSGAALAGIRKPGGAARLYRIDLGSGRATLVGTIGDGKPLRGLAIEP